MTDSSANETKMYIDTSEWPLIVVTTPKGTVSDALLANILDRFNEIVKEKREQYALVLDVSKTEKLNATQRKQLVAKMNSNKAFNAMYCAGSAMVFDSALLKGMLTAIFWVFKPDYETKVFTSKTDAVAWAQTRL